MADPTWVRILLSTWLDREPVIVADRERLAEVRREMGPAAAGPDGVACAGATP